MLVCSTACPYCNEQDAACWCRSGSSAATLQSMPCHWRLMQPKYGGDGCLPTMLCPHRPKHPNLSRGLAAAMKLIDALTTFGRAGIACFAQQISPLLWTHACLVQLSMIVGLGHLQGGRCQRLTSFQGALDSDFVLGSSWVLSCTASPWESIWRWRRCWHGGRCWGRPWPIRSCRSRHAACVWNAPRGGGEWWQERWQSSLRIVRPKVSLHETLIRGRVGQLALRRLAILCQATYPSMAAPRRSKRQAKPNTGGATSIISGTEAEVCNAQLAGLVYPDIRFEAYAPRRRKPALASR